MPELDLFPLKLDRQTAPEALDRGDARILQRVEIKKAPGIAVRARGQVRCSGYAGNTYTVRNCAVFERQDGVKGLVYADANGGVYLLLGAAPANVDADYGL